MFVVVVVNKFSFVLDSFSKLFIIMFECLLGKKKEKDVKKLVFFGLK
jgi:hypothetical protein